MKLESLESLLIHEMKDLLNAEKQLTKALPKMAKAATNPGLRQAFEDHLEETRKQVHRLEEAIEHLGASARGVKCHAMEGLVKEGEELLKNDEVDPHVLDAALICAAQRVEHYEMAGYGCAVTFARQLNHTRVAELLETTLEEEKAADAKLTSLAESGINEAAEA